MFITNNESFVCEHCSKEVAAHPSSSRNHCPFCLYSKHVDNEPGDRANSCKGMMRPIGLEMKSEKTQIVFECEVCGERRKNIVAPDDNQDLLIDLSSTPV